MAPGQLALVGLFIDLGANLGHRLLDLDAGGGDVGDQGARERAVGAFLTVECGLARAGGERDQGAFAGFHFGQACAYRHAAGRGIRLDLRRERIVAAGIEEHQLDLGVAHGLVEREVDVDGGAELDVHFRFDVGVNRQQIVGAADGDAVTGIKEDGDVGALRLLAEVQQLFRHLVAGEVGAFDDLEADIAQHAGHRLGVDRRVRKLGDVLVGAVADHESDAPFGVCGAGGNHHAKQGNNEGWIAHLKSPGRIEKNLAVTLSRDYTKKPHFARQKSGRARKSRQQSVTANLAMAERLSQAPGSVRDPDHSQPLGLHNQVAAGRSGSGRRRVR